MGGGGGGEAQLISNSTAVFLLPPKAMGEGGFLSPCCGLEQERMVVFLRWLSQERCVGRSILVQMTGFNSQITTTSILNSMSMSIQYQK